ncbi:MAG: hypothetical protein L0216_08270 [Planctomycetales bacterium]|nr:hypothetical protein [Planctomycetales bacterium]
MRALASLLAPILVGAPAAAWQEAPPEADPRPAVSWPREGLAQVPAALAEAAASGKKLLVGLAGSPG